MAVCLAKAQERSLGNAQEQRLAKPNGVEEDGGKMGGEILENGYPKAGRAC